MTALAITGLALAALVGWALWQASKIRAEGRQPGQVPPGHPDARHPVPWGEHPRDCNCGDCP